MSFSVNTNIASLQAQSYLRASSDFQAKTINRVTSGLRIVSSGDDAAGLAIANGFRSDQAVLTQGIRNANDGLSTLQTIDGGMNNISQLLDRARTLATQSASGTFTGGATGRAQLNSEFQSVLTEIDRQAQSIGLNQNGEFAKALSVFIGGGKGITASDVINNGSVSVDLSKSTVDTNSLGLNSFRAARAAVNGVNYDLGSSSATSVKKILANATNTASEATAGITKFTFRGPAFSDAANGITISVNVGAVTDTDSLVNAVNAAISTAASADTATNTTAFKNAGITASIATDSNGRQQLAFSAGNTAFQVSADDMVANALMGNFSDSTTALGAAANEAVGAAFGVTTNVALTLTLAGAAGAATITTAALGAAAGIDSVVTKINDAIAGTSGSKTGAATNYHAINDNGKIAIMSNNGKSFTVDGDAVEGVLVGFTNGSLVSSAVNGSTWDSGGAQASTLAGTTTNGTAYKFSTITGSQDVTFSGVHADGTAYTWKTTLDATPTSAEEAAKTLNDALQASSDPSLQKIVAVADTDAEGNLGVKFMSSDAFSVKFSAPTGGGLEDASTGATVTQGAILSSATSSGAGLSDISNQTSASAAVTALASAVAALGDAQAVVGKGQNNFNFAVNLAQSQVTNLAAAESRIRDADLAQEAANLSKAQILVQAGTAALAQANSAPQAILSLLRG